MHWKFTLEELRRDNCEKKRKCSCTKWRCRKKRCNDGGRSSVARGETVPWKHNVGGRRRGARVVVEGRRNSCRERERHCPIGATTGRSSVARGKTRRWQHNDGGRRRGARVVVSPKQLQREMEEMQRARKKKRGSHFCALIKLYGLGSIDNRGIQRYLAPVQCHPRPKTQWLMAFLKFLATFFASGLFNRSI